jgi:phosphopantothenoylcysteine synthetase/decarboxylase
MRVLITSGGTKVKIDMVRHIGNMSSGTFGSRIALEALKRDHDVTFLKAKGSKDPFTPELPDRALGIVEYDMILEDARDNHSLYGKKFNVVTYEDFYDYQDKLYKLIENDNYDSIVLAAAVSDYGVKNYVDGKIRSKDSEMNIELDVLPKVISGVRSRSMNPNAYIVGFKLLVNSTDSELIYNATKQLYNNKLDLVVANDLRDIKCGDHRLHLVSDSGVELFSASESEGNHYYLSSKVVTAIEKGIKK